MPDVDAPADPLAAVTHPDPYPFYDNLVRNRLFYFDETLGTWVASSAQAVSAVLASSALRVRPPDELIPRALVDSAAGDLFGKFVRMRDGADRDRVKSVVARRIDTLDEQRVARAADSHAAALFAQLGRPPDWGRFTSDFSLRLPTYVMTDLLDIEKSAAPSVCEWLDDFIRCLSPAASAAQIDRGNAAARRLSSAQNTKDGFAAGLMLEARREGTTDPQTALANAVGLLFQTYEATAGLIGNALIALSRRSDLVGDARRDPSELRRVVEQTTRDDSPVQNTRRFAAERWSALGQNLEEGDRILVVVAAANRDRAGNGRIFTFGSGPHACPGEAIATTIATKALECIVGQRVDLAPVARAVSYRPSANVRVPVFALA